MIKKDEPLDVAMMPQEEDLTPLVGNLAGTVRGRNEAAANQSILNIARRSGGDTRSPLFQFLSSTARSGAAGQTGSTMAGLTLQASEAGAARNLQRQMANQSAALQARQIANQMTLGMGGLDLSRERLGLEEKQVANQFLLGRVEAARNWGPYSSLGQQMLGTLGFSQGQGNIGGTPNPFDPSRGLYHFAG